MTEYWIYFILFIFFLLIFSQLRWNLIMLWLLHIKGDFIHIPFPLLLLIRRINMYHIMASLFLVASHSFTIRNSFSIEKNFLIQVWGIFRALTWLVCLSLSFFVLISHDSDVCKVCNAISKWKASSFLCHVY